MKLSRSFDSHSATVSSTCAAAKALEDASARSSLRISSPPKCALSSVNDAARDSSRCSYTARSVS